MPQSSMRECNTFKKNADDIEVNKGMKSLHYIYIYDIGVNEGIYSL